MITEGVLSPFQTGKIKIIADRELPEQCEDDLTKRCYMPVKTEAGFS